MPTEKPILFSGPMVRAILEGRKSMTRRVVKMAGIDFRGGGGKAGPDWNDPSCWGFEDEDGREWALAPGDSVDEVIPCPYHRGQRLWVRETWTESVDKAGKAVVVYRADGAAYGILCDADGEGDVVGHNSTPVECAFDLESLRWRPSIFMPRWACRTMLEVTDVRVERLQEITEEDAITEGVGPGFVPCPHPQFSDVQTTRCVGYRPMFQRLWNEINSKRGFGWDVNPFVRVISFKRVA